MSLLQRSVAAGILVICILILRRTISARVSGNIFLLLWKIAVLRFLLPVAVQVERTAYLYRRKAGPVMLSAGKGEEGAGLDTEALEIFHFARENIWLAWLLGMSFLLLVFVIGYARAYFQLREAIPFTGFEEGDAVVGRRYRELTKGVKIKILDKIAAPISFGIFYPRIILPKTMDFEDEEALGYVLRHEMVHIRRRDNLWKLLLNAALCLHWFNPLIYAMYFCMNIDMEIACDENVIAGMGEKDRQKYAMTLVAFAEAHSLCTKICSGFGQSAISERIRKIMDYKKMTKAGSLCAALILLGSMAAFVSAKEVEAGNDAAAEACLAAEASAWEGTAASGGSAGKAEEEAENVVRVFFESGIPGERIEEIGNELLAMDQVEGIEYTSPEDAWEVFAKKYLTEDIALSFTENPLEDSGHYTVYLTESSEGTRQAILKIGGVRRIGEP